MLVTGSYYSENSLSLVNNIYPSPVLDDGVVVVVEQCLKFSIRCMGSINAFISYPAPTASTRKVIRVISQPPV